jgi:hypothetical protein
MPPRKTNPTETFTGTVKAFFTRGRVVFEWTADTAGEAFASFRNLVDAELASVVTIPAGSTEAPTAAYDVTLEDEFGFDMLRGLAADRSATATEEVFTDMMIPHVVSTPKFSFHVQNAGSGNGGTVMVYFKPGTNFGTVAEGGLTRR